MAGWPCNSQMLTACCCVLALLVQGEKLDAQLPDKLIGEKGFGLGVCSHWHPSRCRRLDCHGFLR